MAIFNTGLGIDISDHHVRFARMSHSGRPTSLLEIKLPHGLIIDDQVTKPKTLKKELEKRMQESGFVDTEDKATILIPESRVFSTSFLIDKGLRGEEFTAQAVGLAQKEIPIPFTECYVDVHKGRRVDSQSRVSVLAIEKSVVNGLVQAFGSMSFKAEMMESNNAALHRVYREYHKKEFTLPSEEDLVMIVDIGHRWSNITLYGTMSASVFSRSIALRELSDTSRGVVKSLTKEMIQKICERIKQILDLYADQGLRTPLVIVAGVEGIQDGICNYCSKIIKKCVIKRIGDVVDIPDLASQDVHVYGAAIGAGLRASKIRSFSKEHKIIIS